MGAELWDIQVGILSSVFLVAGRKLFHTGMEMLKALSLFAHLSFHMQTQLLAAFQCSPTFHRRQGLG